MTTLTINKLDYDLNVLVMKITATSEASVSSGRTVEADFEIGVIHPCRQVALDPPMWIETFLQFDYRDLNKDLDFLKASFSAQPECGDTAYGSGFAITHRLTEVNEDPFSFQIFSNQIVDQSTARISGGIGTYTFNIIAESVFGSENGPNPIEVDLVDLCLTTEYVMQEPPIPILIEATALGPEVCLTFAEPITQLDIDLGGTRICGAPVYELTVVSGTTSQQQFLTLNSVNR